MNETRVPRRIALGTLAVVLAILLGGPAASPAHAADNNRPQAIAAANDFIADCIGNGGEPEIEMEEGYGWTTVTCLYDEDYEYCFFYYDGTTSCGREPYGLVKPLPGRWDDLPILESLTATTDVGGTEPPATVTEPQASGSESSAFEDATPGPGVNGSNASDAQQSVASPMQDQDDTQSAKGKGKAKKSKKGKKGGKHRRR
jgi:hypothetical protein